MGDTDGQFGAYFTIALLDSVAGLLPQETDKQDIAAVATKLKIDGLVVSNTTIARPPEVRCLHVPSPHHANVIHANVTQAGRTMH